MGVKSVVGKQLAPRIAELAPGMTTLFVRESLIRAIDGVGPLPPAAAAADKQLREQKGDVDRAIHEVIENNVRLAGAQGFVTNLGGLVTAGRRHPGQHHRPGPHPVPDDRRHRPPARLRPRRPEGQERHPRLPAGRGDGQPPGEGQEGPGTADGAGHRAGVRRGHGPGRRRRGRRRPDRQGRRQAAGRDRRAGGSPSWAGSSAWASTATSTWQIGRYADRELLPLARR